MIQSPEDAREFAERIHEFVELDTHHLRDTDETRFRVSLHYALVPGLWERTTIYVAPDGTWTSEYTSVLDPERVFAEKEAVPNPAFLVWEHRQAVNNLLDLREEGSLVERLYGIVPDLKRPLSGAKAIVPSRGCDTHAPDV